MDPKFSVEAETGVDAETLVVGTATPALAGLTATDYLVDDRAAEQVGHVDLRGYPTLAPFEDGRPRHHTRLYDLGTVAALVGELFVPLAAVEPFADALWEWVDDAGVEEVVVLHGVPFPHGPEDHAVFAVGTDRFREDLEGIEPLSGGVLDGVAGELVARGLEPGASAVGAYVTPVHPPGPDFEAAILLLGALAGSHDLAVDVAGLQERSAELRAYYEELASRLEAVEGGREESEDRMYM
jgi:uncharacterized protein